MQTLCRVLPLARTARGHRLQSLTRAGVTILQHIGHGERGHVHVPLLVYEPQRRSLPGTGQHRKSVFAAIVSTTPQVLADPTSFDVAVTTYEMVTSAHFGAALSHTITWRLLVLDEGHKIKNEETRVANAMRHVACAPIRSL